MELSELAFPDGWEGRLLDGARLAAAANLLPSYPQGLHDRAVGLVAALLRAPRHRHQAPEPTHVIRALSNAAACHTNDAINTRCRTRSKVDPAFLAGDQLLHLTSTRPGLEGCEGSCP